MELTHANECWHNMVEQLSTRYSPTQMDNWFRPLTVFYCDPKYLILRAGSSFNADHINRQYGSVLYNLAPLHFNLKFETVKVMCERDCQAFELTINASRLNPKYTFESFVTGQGNILAYSASIAVAEDPGSNYNPLFLYGGAGLGKTHLMTAIANYVLLQNPNTHILFYSSEQFTNEVVEAIRQKTTPQLRDKMRSVDILLVDDIQLLAGRSATQEEFFNTFNDLYSRGKQIVISADKPPESLAPLEERMRSRFRSGIVYAIDKPDFETRIAILKNKASEDEIEMDDEAVSRLAELVDTNIRELEGALNTCAFTARNAPGSNGRVTLDIVNASAFSAAPRPPREKKSASPEAIIEEVARRYGVAASDILSPKRNREVTVPRQMAMYLVKSLCNFSTPNIGKTFGRDHSTVIYALKQAETLMKDSREFQQMLESVMGEMN